MTFEQRQRLREVATRAARACVERGVNQSWELQTSNSFRRIGTSRGDGDVLCAATQRSDGHPDLLAPPGVLDYIVATQPSVMLKLLDQLDAAEQSLARLAEIEARLESTDRKLRETQVLVDQLRAVVGQGQS